MHTDRGRRAIVVVVFSSMFLFGVFFNLRATWFSGISAEFGVSYTGSGLVFLVGIVSVVFSNMLSGRLMARRGMRLLYTGSILAAAFLFLLQSWSPVYAWFLGSTLLLHFASGGQHMSGNTLVASAFAGDGGRTLSRLHLWFGLGALLAPPLAAVCAEAGLTWREGFRALAVLYVAVLAWLPFHALREPARGQGPAVVRVRDILAAYRLPTVRRLALAVAFAVAFEIALTSWLVYTLEAGWKWTPQAAGAVLAAFYVLFATGRFAGSLFAARWRLAERLAPLLFCAGVLAVAGALLLPHGAWLMAASGLACAVVFPMLFYRLTEGHPHLRATAVPAFLLGSGIGGSILPFLVGVVDDLAGVRWGLVLAASYALAAAALVPRGPVRPVPAAVPRRRARQ